MNIQFTTEWIGGTINTAESAPTIEARTVYAHFIFVKFVRDGAMN